MKYSVTYPLVTHPYNPEFLTKEGLVSIRDGGRDSGVRRNRFHRPPGTHPPLAAGGRS